MVSLRDIKEDYFIFDEKNYCVYGKSTKVKFTLGDKVRIKVSKVNLEQKLIDYELVWDAGYGKEKGKKKTVGKSKAVAKGKTVGKRTSKKRD